MLRTLLVLSLIFISSRADAYQYWNEARQRADRLFLCVQSFQS